MTLDRLRTVLTQRLDEPRRDPAPLEDAPLDPARTADYLAVARAIAAQTGGAVGGGVITCPICGTGALAYQVTATATPDRHQVRAVCQQAGCIRFTT